MCPGRPDQNSSQQPGNASERADYQKAYKLIVDDAGAEDARLQYTAATLMPSQRFWSARSDQSRPIDPVMVAQIR